MNTEEMFLTILNRMDSIEAGLTGLNSRMDKLETSLNGKMDELDSRMDKLEYNAVLELYLVRTEIYKQNKSLEMEIGTLSSKVDRVMFTKDVEEYDKINIRLEMLERGYQELKDKIV